MSSRTRVTLPNFLAAASCAACGDIPRAMLSSVSMRMYDAISRAASASRLLREKKRVQLMSLLRGPHHLPDRAHELFPARGFGGEHFLSRRRQTVVLRLAIIFGGAPERCDQGAILEA